MIKIVHKALISLIVSGALVITFAGGISPAQAQSDDDVITLVLGHNLDSNDPLLRLFLRRWANYFNQVTGKRGRIVLRGPQDGRGGRNGAVAPDRLHELLLKGKVDLAFVNLFDTEADEFFYSKLFALPFVARDTETASLAFWEVATNYLQNEYKGLKLLSLHVDPYQILHYGSRPPIHLADNPVTSMVFPGDFKGRVVATQNQHAAQFINFSQGTTVTVPFFANEKARLFTLGRVDAFWLNWSGIPPKSQLTLLNRHTVIKGFGTPYYFAFNRKHFNLLPKHWQKILRTSLGGENLVTFAAEVTEHIHTQEIKRLKSQGDVVFTLNPEQQHIWQNDSYLYISSFFKSPEHINDKSLQVVFNLMKETMSKIDRRKNRTR